VGLGTGFLGAYTTFSSMAVEGVLLIAAGRAATRRRRRPGGGARRRHRRARHRRRVPRRLHHVLDGHVPLRLAEDGAWVPVALNLLLSGPLCFAGAGVAYWAAR
jgi:hypothetical protein